MTSVDDAYANFNSLSAAVSNSDLSALNFANEIGAKTLLIAAAGDLERRFCGALLSLFQRQNTPAHLVSFVEHQALDRKFHTLFNWKTNNANGFIGLFGEDKKEELKDILNKEPYDSQLKDFLYIGRTRNEIVHIGLTTASIGNTMDEVYSKYRSALSFVNFIQLNL